MSEKDQKRIFSKNLNKYLSDAGKTQKEIADAIGVSPQTFNTWVQGIALPRMGKVQTLADYFHINKSDLIEENQDYYHDSETSAIAQELFENKDLRVLFDAARDASAADLQTTYAMLMALKNKERGDTDDAGC